MIPENSPSTKRAIKKAFEYLNSLSDEEFEQELKNAPCAFITELLKERDYYKDMMLKSIRRCLQQMPKTLYKDNIQENE